MNYQVAANVNNQKAREEISRDSRDLVTKIAIMEGTCMELRGLGQDGYCLVTLNHLFASVIYISCRSKNTVSTLPAAE